MCGVLRSEATVRDAAGFEALYLAHRRHVVAYCLRRAPRCDAFEAAVETLLIAWRRFEEIPSGQERAWLYGVARRVLSNQHRGDHRRGRLNRRLAQTDAFPNPEAHTLQSAERQALWGAYRRLSADDQEVLRLAAWEELPPDQIGVALECTPDAARQRLHRARGRLAGQLERTERPLAGTRRRHDA
jgi:RNA polymerase sigma factor (sigma-70 family)